MRCFSSPGSLPAPMYSGQDDPKGPGFPIRKSTDQSLLTAPRGLSQRATSFIASRCQGIHQMPLRRLTQPPVSLGPQRPEVDGVRRAKPRSNLRDPDSRHETTPEDPPINKSRSPGQACRLSKFMLNPIHDAKQRWPAAPVKGVPGNSITAASLVEVIGIEPTTSCLQSRRSPN
jgi:hypothetical protein